MAERDKLKWWCLGRRKKGGEAFGLTYSILNSSVFSRETTSILNSSASCCTLAQNYSTLTLIFLSLYMDLINQSWLQKIPGFFCGNNHIFHTFLWFFFSLQVVVVQAISALCQKYPRKHSVMMTFLSNMLRDDVCSHLLWAGVWAHLEGFGWWEGSLLSVESQRDDYNTLGGQTCVKYLRVAA